MQRDRSKGNLPPFLAFSLGIYDFEAAGSNLGTRLEGCEGCSSSVAATVCPTEPPARPEGYTVIDRNTYIVQKCGNNVFTDTHGPVQAVSICKM